MATKGCRSRTLAWAASKALCLAEQEARILSQRAAAWRLASEQFLAWIAFTWLSRFWAQASQIERWVSSWRLTKAAKLCQRDISPAARCAPELSFGSLMVNSMRKR